MIRNNNFNQHPTQIRAKSNHRERFFELSLDFLCVIGFDGYLKTVNPAWETVLGYSLEELLQDPLLHFIHPDDRQQTSLAFAQIISGEEKVNLEHRWRCHDNSYRWITWTTQPDMDEQAIYAVGRDISDRKPVKTELHSHLQQQAAIATLSQEALTNNSLETLMERAIHLVAQTLSVDYSALLELLPNHQTFILKAGVGWQPQLVGQATLSAHHNSHAGYTLDRGQPIIVEDLRVETRFSGSPLLHNHRVVSGVSAIVNGYGEPFGVLSVYTRQYRHFTEDDVSFLQTIANVLTNAMTRVRAEERLHLMERAIASSNNGIIITDATEADNPIVYVNPAFEEITGYSTAEVIGQNCRFLQGDRQEQPATTEIRHAIETGTECHAVIQNFRKDGTAFWNELRISPVFNSQGHLTHFIGIQVDISDRQKAEERLKHHAFHDHLTNLPNRALLLDHLQQAIDRTQSGSEDGFAVLFLDLDGFKVVNDSLGHLLGDLLLVAIARRLENCLRPCDLLARLGGDEFTIFLNHVKNLQDATTIAQRILEKLSYPFNLKGHRVFINTSIGITLSEIGYHQPDDILRDADLAMYQAKTAGKGRFAVFNPLLHTQAVKRLQLETDLREALWGQQFQLYYQPIINLETGQTSGFEALIRWNHPELGLVSPVKFIPIAEETGLILPMGTWVIEEACRQLHDWHHQFGDRHPLTMNINLSVKQFAQTDLIEQIDRILEQTQVSGQFIKLEITESAIIDNSKVANLIFQQLKDRQIELCIDDFGTGYSSLSYLYRFPVHTLKIDRGFLTHIQSNSSSRYQAIVKAIIDLGHNLGMTIVAEGIEMANQHQLLHNLGCEYGQGYFYSQPIPAQEVENFLRSQSYQTLISPHLHQ